MNKIVVSACIIFSIFATPSYACILKGCLTPVETAGLLVKNMETHSGFVGSGNRHHSGRLKKNNQSRVLDAFLRKSIDEALRFDGVLLTI
ncbi:hypothetical protein JAU75_04290 [Ochrobactrum sp. Q0168]|uniref:hypothetical protein n=1 Tax=Ochrobactrum sp. Q0168 TaxID=2793241 RepID=UPI0018EB8B4A|nr:hypothetical protein [Ochrobactrum sp. Q0168]